MNNLLGILLLSLSIFAVNGFLLYPQFNLNVLPKETTNSNRSVSVRFHYQKIDHFDLTDTRGFWQLFLENRDHFKPGGPIICVIGGQFPGTDIFITAGPLHDVAISQNGLLVFLEPRYFGVSQPFAINTLDSMKYLTVDQNIYDIGHFLEALKNNETDLADSKVIVAGIGLGASYVSWFRQEFPELSVGGWASSAPVEVMPDVPEYKEDMGKTIRKHGSDKCYDKLKDGFETMQKMIEEDDTERIEQLFKLCKPLQSENDAMLLFQGLTVLYGQNLIYANVENSCVLVEAEDDSIDAVHAGIKFWLEGINCYPVNYEETVQILKNVFNPNDGRTSLYLACYELGWFTSGESENQPFSSWPTFDFYVDLCQDVFNDNVTAESMHENADRINAKYGGFQAKFTNVFTTQGEYDPVKVMGFKQNVGPTSPTEVISGAGHAFDLFYWMPETIYIKKARLQAKFLIEDWLNNK